MTDHSIIFFSEFYAHLRVFSSCISLKLIEKTKKIFEAKVQQDIAITCILKKGFIGYLVNFLTRKKITKKKRWLVNKFKQQSSMGKQKSKTVAINFLDNWTKKVLPISILALLFGKNLEDVTMMTKDIYC